MSFNKRAYAVQKIKTHIIIVGYRINTNTKIVFSYGIKIKFRIRRLRKGVERLKACFKNKGTVSNQPPYK